MQRHPQHRLLKLPNVLITCSTRMSRQGTINPLHRDLVVAQEVRNEEGVAQSAAVGRIEGEKCILPIPVKYILLWPNIELVFHLRFLIFSAKW
jgi:hypothetical protein